jgi:hypothetical protein
VRFEIYKAVRMKMMFWRCVDSSVDANVPDKHTVSIFRAEDGDSMSELGLSEQKAQFADFIGGTPVLSA